MSRAISSFTYPTPWMRPPIGCPYLYRNRTRREQKYSKEHNFHSPDTVVFGQIHAPLKVCEILWFKDLTEKTQFLFCDTFKGTQGYKIVDVNRSKIGLHSQSLRVESVSNWSSVQINPGVDLIIRVTSEGAT